MTRSRSSSPAPDVFSIYLFVCLFIYFLRLPRHRRRRRCHRLRLEKTRRLRRDCLPRSRSIGREAPSFLPGVHVFTPPFSITSKVGSKLSKLTRSWRRQLEIVMSPFFVTVVYATRKRKVERSLRGSQDYVSTLRIVDT